MERDQDLTRPSDTRAGSIYGDAFLTRARTLIRQSEGLQQHGYRDNSEHGYFTVGVGHLVPSLDACLQLTWASTLATSSASTSAHAWGGTVTRYDLRQDVLATPDEIEQLWHAVMAMPPGLAARAYTSASPLRQSLQSVSQLLDDDIAHSTDSLRRIFQDFDHFPDSAKLAFLDLCHQVGAKGLLLHFPRLIQAADVQDWKACSIESHRRDSSDERNAETAQLFLAAAATKASANRS